MKVEQLSFSDTPVDWSRMPILPIAEKVRPSDAQVKAWGQICYTRDALLVRIEAQEQPVLPEERGPLAMPCNDSCLEFFLRPVAQQMRYLNFEWNPGGSLYLGIGSCPADLLRIVPSDAQKERLFAPVIQQKPTGWEISFQIPYTFIRCFFPDFEITPGCTLYGNFYKCGDRLPIAHYLAWNPILREGKYLFHTPAEFGKFTVI